MNESEVFAHISPPPTPEQIFRKVLYELEQIDVEYEIVFNGNWYVKQKVTSSVLPDEPIKSFSDFQREFVRLKNRHEREDQSVLKEEKNNGKEE